MRNIRVIFYSILNVHESWMAHADFFEIVNQEENCY